MYYILPLLFVVIYGLDDLRIYDMVPPDNPNGTGTDNLGICFGSSTSWSSYPYAVALRYSGSGSACCSASIIQTQPVGVLVSAAHCNGCTGQARVGCSNPATCAGADSYNIQQFIQHPNYNPSTISSDIAVVRFTTGISTSGAQAINVANVEPSGGASRVTGYGITQTGGIPSQLQTMSSNIIDRQICADIMFAALGQNIIDQTMVCIRGGGAGQENVPTMCSGDSGGPMVSGQNLYGANSFVLQGSGQGCNSCNCCPGYPQVGANVAHFSGWINSQVSQINKEYYESLNKSTQTA